MHVYIYIYIYKYIYMWIYVYIYIYICIYKYVYMYTHTYIYIRVWLCTCIQQNWRLEKIGNSGLKPVILQYGLSTTYCSTSQQMERERNRDNDYMRNKPSSHSTDWLTAPSCHQHWFPCSSSALWNKYHFFSQFWDQLYGPSRLGLRTKMRL